MKTLRRFGAIGFVVLIAAATWQLALDRVLVAATLASLAVAFGVFAVFFPRAPRPVFVGMMVLAFPANWLLAHVMLGIVFYCVFAPFAILFRLIGRDPLRRSRPPGDTYWTVKPGPDGVHSYFRQS